MAYLLKEITIHTDNSENGMGKINEVWQDIVSGKLPLMFDSVGTFQQGLSPISKYTNYESDETGAYDMTIFTVTADFFAQMQERVQTGEYRAYDFDGINIQEAANKAWTQVWEEQRTDKLCRTFTADYESTVPGEYTKDSKAHCYLYIAIKSC